MPIDLSKYIEKPETEEKPQATIDLSKYMTPTPSPTQGVLPTTQVPTPTVQPTPTPSPTMGALPTQTQPSIEGLLAEQVVPALEYAGKKLYSSFVEKPYAGIGEGFYRLARFFTKTLGWKSGEEFSEQGIKTFQKLPVTEQLAKQEAVWAEQAKSAGLGYQIADSAMKVANDVLPFFISAGLFNVLTTPKVASDALRASYASWQQVAPYLKMGGFTAGITPGDPEVRARAAIYSMANTLTAPLAEAIGTTGIGTGLLDSVFNLALSSPYYVKAIQEGGTNQDTFASLFPQIMTDVAFGFYGKNLTDSQRRSKIKAYLRATNQETRTISEVEEVIQPILTDPNLNAPKFNQKKLSQLIDESYRYYENLYQPKDSTNVDLREIGIKPQLNMESKLFINDPETKVGDLMGLKVKDDTVILDAQKQIRNEMQDIQGAYSQRMLPRDREKIVRLVQGQNWDADKPDMTTRDMTLEEVHAKWEAVQNALARSKDNWQFKDETKKKAAQTVADSINQNNKRLPISTDKPLELGAVSSGNFRKWINYGKQLGWENVKLWVKTNMLDGFTKDGAVKKYILNPIYQADSKRLELEGNWNQKDRDLLNSLYPNEQLADYFYKKEKLTDYFSATPDFKVLLSLANKNPIFKGEMEHYLKSQLTETQAQDLMARIDSPNFLNTNERTIEAHLLKHYEETYPILKEAHESRTGMPLGFQGNYFPIRFKYDESRAGDAVFEAIFGTQFKWTEMARQFTKERTGSRDWQPVYGAMQTKFADNAVRAKYIAMGETLDNARKFLLNEDVSKAIKNFGGVGKGENLYKSMLQNVEDIINPRRSKDFDLLDMIVVKTQSNIAVSKLAGSVTSLFKQAISASQAMGKINPGLFLKNSASLAKGLGEYRTVRDWVHENSPFVKNRFAFQFQKELSDVKPLAKFVQGSATGAEALMLLNNAVDHFMSVITYKSAYDDFILKEKWTKPESAFKEAHEYAEAITRETQSGWTPIDLPEIMVGTPIRRMFTIFQQQANSEFNQRLNTILAGKNKKISAPQFVRELLFNTLVPAVASGMISRMMVPTTKDIMEDLITEPISGIPIVGNLVYSAFSGKRASSSVLTAFIDDAFEMANSLGKGNMKRTLYGLAKIASVLGGVPYSQPDKTSRGIKAILDGKTDQYQAILTGMWNRNTTPVDMKQWNELPLAHKQFFLSNGGLSEGETKIIDGLMRGKLKWADYGYQLPTEIVVKFHDTVDDYNEKRQDILANSQKLWDNGYKDVAVKMLRDTGLLKPFFDIQKKKLDDLAWEEFMRRSVITE